MPCPSAILSGFGVLGLLHIVCVCVYVCHFSDRQPSTTQQPQDTVMVMSAICDRRMDHADAVMMDAGMSID